MEIITLTQQPNLHWLNSSNSKELLTPFSQKRVSITQQEHIELKSQVNYYKAQFSIAKDKIKKLEQKIQEKEGKIKDLKKKSLWQKKREEKIE